MRRQTAVIACLLAGGAAVVVASATGLAPWSGDAEEAAQPPEMLAELETPVAEPAAVELADAPPGSDIEALRATIEARDAEIAGLRADLATRQAELDDLGGTLEERDAEIARLTAALAASEAALADLESRLKVLEDASGAQPAALAAPAASDATGIDVALDAAKAPDIPAALGAPAADAGTPATTLETAAPPPGAPLGQIHFETASSRLTPGGMVRALEAAEALAAMQVGRIRVEGYTDRVGNPDFNQRLSQARAEAVVAVLIDAGVPADAIELAPMGEAPDMAPIATDDGVAEPLNRCVSIVPVEA